MDAKGSTKKETTAKNVATRKGKEAARKFLESKNYSIMETDWSCKDGKADFIAKDSDEEELVFLNVQVESDFCAKALPNDDISDQARKKWEKIVVSYLKKNECSDCRLRFDLISILVVSEERAFLRHHKNVFSF